MIPTIDSTAFDRGTDPILQFLTIPQARGITQYRGDAELQPGRVHDRGAVHPGARAAVNRGRCPGHRPQVMGGAWHDEGVRSWC